VTTRRARITPCTVGVEVVLALQEWCISPREQILEYRSWIVKALCPASPGADLAEWPTQHYSKVLAASAAERVSSIGPRINANVKEVVAEALKEGVGSLVALDQQDPIEIGLAVHHCIVRTRTDPISSHFFPEDIAIHVEVELSTLLPPCSPCADGTHPVLLRVLI